MVPQWVAEMQTSDWLMFAFAALLLFFVLDYGTGTPWWKAPVSTFTFEYGLSVLALISLIIYGVVMGERVEEWARIPVMFGLCVGVLGKIIVLKVSRRQGRIARRERRRHLEAVSSASIPPLEGIPPMSTPDLSLEEIKDVSTIWFKAQRALRTAFSTFITILPLAPQVIAIVNGQWQSEFLIAVGVQAVALNAVVSRIMAIPQVNAFLTKWLNLGSIPKQNISAKGNPITGNFVVTVEPDRKALKNG